ncbi:MAG: S8 family serine peptidase, partial [Flavobacteriales bacterium]
MIRAILTLGFILGVCFAFSQSSEHLPGQLIVKLKPNASPDKLTNFFSDVRGQNIDFKQEQKLSSLSNIYLFSFNELINDEKMIEMVRVHSSVALVQFNHIVEDRSTLPNDTEISSQWHHQNNDDADVDTDLAWDTTTGGTTILGDEIVVCVIEDGGSNYNHTDLIDNHWVNTAEIPNNNIDDDNNGFVDDYDGWNPVSLNDNVGFDGHGTAVSGMIGAKGNNSLGGAGINWDVKIMQVGLGSLTESNVIAAYNYPFTMRSAYNASGGSEGAFVVATNASWGIDNADPSDFPVWCAYYDDLGQAGILNCGATSNSAVNVDVSGDMPTGCSSDYMISVTATNNQDERTFSGYGQTTIDLAAPGESVYLPSGSSSYSATTGTSFASPCVAGAIALIYSAPCSDLAQIALSNPQEAANMVRSYILNGVDP